MKKVYIGDAVYAVFDGGGITLTTEDGIRVTNSIYLEMEVILALQEYIERCQNEKG